MLYIMRHGKTEWNSLHKLQGRTDCPINVIFEKPEEYVESVGGAETFEQLFKRTGSLPNHVLTHFPS